MTERHRFILAHQPARQRALQAVAQAPDGYVVTVAEPTRSGDQNAALHAHPNCEPCRRREPGREQWQTCIAPQMDSATGECGSFIWPLVASVSGNDQGNGPSGDSREGPRCPPG